MSNSAAPSILRTVQDVRQWRNSLSDPTSVGFVPTMGALHEGHLQLVRHSLSSHQHTIVSIFLNPTQFGANEDLSSYPSTLEADLAKLTALNILPGSYPVPHDGFDGISASPTSASSATSVPPSGSNSYSNATSNQYTPSVATDPPSSGSLPKDVLLLRRVSAVFLPTSDVLYPSGIATDVQDQRGAFVTVHGLSEQLEGARRPGFFRGVATVVLKLFMITEPTIAYFGQKDLQQCLLVRQMCKDLHVIRPISIIAIPTVRDSLTGLALSSRNSYLSPSEAQAAKVLFNFLRQCAEKLETPGCSPTIEELAESFCSPTSSISLDFISINDPITFDTISCSTAINLNTPIAISGAVLVKCNIGRVVRLIDNIIINYDLNQCN